MGRILGIDYGIKNCGLAATDTLKIAVHGLRTVTTNTLWDWLNKYLVEEDVEKIVIGRTTHKDGTTLYFQTDVDDLVLRLNKTFPQVTIDFHEEAFTSVKAQAIILQSGVKKQKRQVKSLLDKISAVVILQEYLKHI